MDVDKTIVFVAVSMGVYQLVNEFNNIYNMKGLEEYDRAYVISGIITSLLWTVYQYRQGSNYYAMYSAAGLLLGVYTLVQLYRRQKYEA
jgi:hypothetical protein